MLGVLLLAASIDGIAKGIVLAGAVVGALLVIWQKVILPPIRFAQRVEKAMSRVEHELGNNGGGTLRDRVDSISAEQTALAARLDTLEHLVRPKPVRTRTTTK